MLRYFIHVGDKTTAGGIVIDGADSTFGFGGQALGVEGSQIQCPACNSVGVGVPVQPYRKHTIQGKQALLSDDLCRCKCDPPPKMIASRTDMAMSFTTDEAAALSAEGAAASGGAVASAAASASTSGSTPLSRPRHSNIETRRQA